MRKKELTALPEINVTQEMLDASKNNDACKEYEYKYNKSKTKKETMYDLMFRCKVMGKYLVAGIFLPEEITGGNAIPLYTVYCDPEKDEFITRIRECGKNEKWSSAMIENLQKTKEVSWNASWYSGTEERVWRYQVEARLIKKILKTDAEGFFAMIEWQRGARKRKIERAEAKEQAPWDADMKLVPDIFPSFEGWMKKEGPRKYFMFYEYSRKGATEGYCSHCGSWTRLLEKPRHNNITVCCHCGKEVTFKVMSKIKTLGTGWYRASAIQKIKGGMVIRTYEQCQWYRDRDFRDPDSMTCEVERYVVLDGEKPRRYYWGNYKNKKTRWIHDKDCMSYRIFGSAVGTKLYKKNLQGLKKTVLKNSAIDLWESLPVDAQSYLVIEKGNPAVEKLARIGMFRLAEGLILKRYEDKLLNQEATELTKMLKIDKARLKRLKEINGTVAHLKWYQYEKMVNRAWPDEMIKDFGDAGFESSGAFGFLAPPLSYVKIWNYLKKQSAMSGERMSAVKNTWQDYMNMAKRAKLDVKNEQIWKPKDLKAAHQEVVLMLQKGKMEEEAKKLEKKWPKVNKNLEKLQKFEYSDGKYLVAVPKGIIDIVREGTALKHCVHTCDFYFDRIQRDESYLFFLRKAEHPDVPWYTLEVEPSGNIRQKRTIGDNQNKDFEDAVKFLKKWQKEFKKRMTEEEKQLGERADQARLVEYAELRKNGNKVWHGRLAGQLLADVLEADFMQAAT